MEWGDGTATDVAQFDPDRGNSYLGTPANELYVNGPEHTYATPGTYSITISVTAPGATKVTVYTDTATISAAPYLAGALDPASDTGFFNDDNVTADSTPTFTGTTAPGATVVLSTTSIDTKQTLVVGSTVADSSGNWSVTTVPFVDGTYSFSATSTSTFRGSTTVSITGGPLYPDNITIDATGPKVSGFQVANLKTGTFQVYYSDPAGLLVGPTVDANLIAVSRTMATGGGSQSLRVTSLKAQNPDTTGSIIPASALVPVVGTFATGKPIPKNGTYTFTIYSAGVISLSGAPLDGEFNGQFPSGNGVAGGNYQVKVVVRNGKVSGPLPITSASIATKAVHAKAVGKHHA